MALIHNFTQRLYHCASKLSISVTGLIYLFNTGWCDSLVTHLLGLFALKSWYLSVNIHCSDKYV